MTANRLCAPESNWGVGPLAVDRLPSDLQRLKLNHMYEAMDILHEHASVVEKAVFFETANLFNLSVDLIFTIQQPPLFIPTMRMILNVIPTLPPKFGHSKEGTWTPR